MKRLLTIGILVLAVAAMLVAPAYAAASPRPAASFYTPAALRAMGLRWQAMADAQASAVTPDDRVGIRGSGVLAGTDRPAASFYTPAALKAMGERYEAQAQYVLTHGSNTTPDDRGGIRGTGPVSTVQAVADDGVDWGNVGIGVGSGVFALLVASGMIFTVRRSRRVAHA